VTFSASGLPGADGTKDLVGAAGIPPCPHGNSERHLCVIKVKLLIFGSVLRLVGGGHGLDRSQPAIGDSENRAPFIVCAATITMAA
jgi:hypothetical protein